MAHSNITFVLPGRGLSGGARVVVIYGNKLIERGHRVTIVLQRWPVLWRPKALAERLWRRFAYATGLSHDHIHDFKGRVLCGEAANLRSAVPDGDVVVATHWLSAGPVADLPASKGRKFYFIQRYEADVFDAEAVDATWRLPMRKIVIARHLEHLARERFGDPDADLIFNGVDRAQFHAPPRPMHDPPTVGLLYSTLAFKGVEVAFEAIRLARRKVPSLRVVTFGAMRPTAALPLPEHCEFHYRPAQHRIRDIYAACDVWLCASRSEGFHLPPLEAMACRCPVVSTRVGGPAECVRPGVNGHLTEVGDAAALADGILRILRDPKQWSEMSAAAYATAIEFDWDRAAERFEAALTSDDAARVPM